MRRGSAMGVVPRVAEKSCVVAGKADELAHTDWVEDSGGHPFIDYPRFIDGWFQLADLWTDGVAPTQYAHTQSVQQLWTVIMKSGPIYLGCCCDHQVP